VSRCNGEVYCQMRHAKSPTGAPGMRDVYLGRKETDWHRAWKNQLSGRMPRVYPARWQSGKSNSLMFVRLRPWIEFSIRISIR